MGVDGWVVEAGVSSRAFCSSGASMSSGDDKGETGEVEGSSWDEVSTISGGG